MKMSLYTHTNMCMYTHTHTHTHTYTHTHTHTHIHTHHLLDQVQKGRADRRAVLQLEMCMLSFQV